MGFLTAWMEKHVIGAKGNDWSLTMPDRFLIAGRALWFYLGKLIWPSPLIFIYPRWDLNPAAWWQWVFPVAAAGLLLLLWRLRRELGKAPLAALLFFAITLFPALGFFDVYPFRYSFVADHFQYLASMGPIALAAGGIAMLTARATRHSLALPARGERRRAARRTSAASVEPERTGVSAISRNNGIGNSKSPSPQPSPGIPGEGAEGNAPLRIAANRDVPLLAAIVCMPVLVILGALTWHQCLMYSDLKTFYQTIIAENPGCWMAHDNLSVVLLQEGHADDSMSHSQRSLMLKPDDATADVNLGNALISQGRLDEAIWQYQRAIVAQPDFPEAESDLGNALLFKREFGKAVTHYARAIQLKADYAEAHNNLGYALMQMGDLDEAIAEFKKALSLRANYAQARENLGNAMARRG